MAAILFIRWTIYVTDWVANGCTNQRRAVTNAIPCTFLYFTWLTGRTRVAFKKKTEKFLKEDELQYSANDIPEPDSRQNNNLKKKLHYLPVWCEVLLKRILSRILLTTNFQFSELDSVYYLYHQNKTAHSMYLNKRGFQQAPTERQAKAIVFFPSNHSTLFFKKLFYQLKFIVPQLFPSPW